MGNGHFDQVTPKQYHIYSFIHWILHMKFELKQPSEFLEKDA